MTRTRTVVKVGTSTLTYDNGKINYRRIAAARMYCSYPRAQSA